MYHSILFLAHFNLCDLFMEYQRCFSPLYQELKRFKWQSSPSHYCKIQSLKFSKFSAVDRNSSDSTANPRTRHLTSKLHGQIRYYIDLAYPRSMKKAEAPSSSKAKLKRTYKKINTKYFLNKDEVKNSFKRLQIACFSEKPRTNTKILSNARELNKAWGRDFSLVDVAANQLNLRELIQRARSTVKEIENFNL